MRIAILSYSLHTGCITTSLKKSLRHNKTDCIITFFSPYRVHFYYSSHHLLKGACTVGIHRDEKKKRKAEQGREEKEGTVNTHFCQGILVKKSKETKGADGWRWS